MSPLADDNHQACPWTQSTLGHHASFSIEAIEVNLLGANFVELEKSAILLTKVWDGLIFDWMVDMDPDQNTHKK